MPRTTTPPDLERLLMIKTKTCQRLIKEVAFYKEEVKENEMKLAEMKQQGDKDVYDIKRFANVLQESYMMVPDSTKRLEQALYDLSEFLTTHGGSCTDHDTSEERVDTTGPWYIVAQQLLQDNNPLSVPVVQKHDTGFVATNVDDLADDEVF